MTITFPETPGDQTPTNTFSPTSTPDENDANNATYVWNNDNNQWVYSGPNVDPSTDTEITTPTITTPADGTTNLDPTANVDVVSSNFAGTEAGAHASSTWQVIEGIQPRVSTNMVTDSEARNANYTARATWDCNQSSTGGINETRMRTIQNVVRTVAAGTTNARLWACVWNGGASNKQGRCNVFFSEDNGITWTDDSARFNVGLNGMNWSPGGYQPVGQFGYWGYPTFGPMIPLVDGTGWTLICNGNCMAPSNNITAGVRYEAETDTYTNLGTTGCNVNAVYSYGGWIGQIHDTTTEDPTNRWVFGDTSGSFGKNILDIETMTSLSSTQISNLTTLGTFTNNGEIYFGRGGNGKASDLSPTGWFTCPITSDVTNPANRTQVTNNEAAGENWGSAFYEIYWWDAGNRFIMPGQSGVIMTYDPDEEVFVQHRLAVTDNINAFFFDGGTHWFITNKQRIITTTDFNNFFYDTISQGQGRSSFPVFFDDQGANLYICTVQNENNDEVVIATATQPTDGLILDIAGAQTDGFVVSNQIENRGGERASGTINALDDTEVTVVNVEGNWSAPETDGENPSQRIAIPVDQFNTIIDDRDDTDNLTTLTIPQNLVTPNSNYRVRVQYRSNTNVVSDVSNWSEFETGA